MNQWARNKEAETNEIIISVFGTIALAYYIFLLCYVVPRVKKILAEAPSEELIDERYYILSPTQVVVGPRPPGEDGIELQTTNT